MFPYFMFSPYLRKYKLIKDEQARNIMIIQKVLGKILKFEHFDKEDEYYAFNPFIDEF